MFANYVTFHMIL